MVVSKESYGDLQEQYEKVKKLIDENSKYDPETDPFLSQYCARQILIGMNANLEKILRSHEPGTKDYIKLIGMQGSVQLQLAVIAIDTEEFSIAETHLNKCLEVIEKFQNEPETALIVLSAFNQNGILWSKRDPEKSKVFLEKAKAFYTEVKKNGVNIIDFDQLFVTSLDEYDHLGAMVKFEKKYTLSLYYLAQMYGVLKDALKSSVYYHVTLRRQLEFDDYESIDWALNTAALSQFFMEKAGFKQARHHLAASSYMLDKYENALGDVTEQNEEYDAKVETLKHRSADVARCWAKYGILLLSTSKDRLLNHTDDIDFKCTLPTDLAKLKLDEDSTISEDDLQNLYFPTLELSEYENRITSDFVLTITDAHAVFLNIQKWLTKAATYYTLENLASDYLEICGDQSQMYENLIFFEESPENQAKLYKRQADILESALQAVNPVYYLQYCRQMWFTLGQIYTEILNIKLDKMKEMKGRPSPHALSKINSLTDKGIHFFQKFIESFRDANTKEIPTTVPDDLQKPFLQSYFYIGALQGRYMVLGKEKLLENVEASIRSYKKVTEYTTNNPKSEELITTELTLVREMITLLPLKIMKLKLETGMQTSTQK